VFEGLKFELIFGLIQELELLLMFVLKHLQQFELNLRLKQVLQ
jgi:hypothetical protein